MHELYRAELHRLTPFEDDPEDLIEADIERKMEREERKEQEKLRKKASDDFIAEDKEFKRKLKEGGAKAIMEDERRRREERGLE